MNKKVLVILLLSPVITNYLYFSNLDPILLRLNATIFSTSDLQQIKSKEKSPNLNSTLDSLEKMAQGISTIKAGETKLLPDGKTRVRFANTGSTDAIPDIYWDRSDKSFSDSLPLKREVSFYSKGLLIQLKNLGCNTEQRLTDTIEIWATDCKISMSSSKVEPPELKPSVPKTYIPVSTHRNIGNGYLAYIMIPRALLLISQSPYSSENFALKVDKMTSGSHNTNLPIQIIVADGIKTIYFTPGEIYDEKMQTVIIGRFKVTAEMSHECRELPPGYKMGSNCPFEVGIQIDDSGKEPSSNILINSYVAN